MNRRDEDTRASIVTHSIKLFMEKGFVGTSVKDVTDAVGIARGTLYWHFSSKDQILDQILDRYSEQYVDRAIETVNNCGGDFLNKFHALYRFITEFARDNKELLMVFATLVGEISRNGTDAARKIKEIRSKPRRCFEALLSMGQREGLVAKDLDVSLHAYVIEATFAGMFIEWFVDEGLFNAAAYSKAFRQIMLKGWSDKTV